MTAPAETTAAGSPAPGRTTPVADAWPTAELLEVLRSFKRGDFSVRLSGGPGGAAGEIAQAVNDVIELNQRLAQDLERLKKVVGREGNLEQRLTVENLAGSWLATATSVNQLVADLVQPTAEVGRVIVAFASGDLSQKMALEVGGRPLQGELLRVATLVNGMVEQLGAFAFEVTQVVCEVDTEGRLGGQAKVLGVGGLWNDLTENVNLLAGTAKMLETKNREVGFARGELEAKAEQLALTSKYKSEFLANMSHELRTPLNSLLILSKMLSANSEGNLTDKQIESARIIHSAGADLLELITDILDLSKIESGTFSVDPSEVSLGDVRDHVEQAFRHVADARRLAFGVRLGAGLPRSMTTDAKRLQQILKNLLSNAMKFTERGQVTLGFDVATQGWSRDQKRLSSADTVVAFSVADTGIGIPLDKQQIIFEAFQQCDGTTSRTYGGTGLGLSISRELARLLGGELRVVSAPGQGSTFTLYLPLHFQAGAAVVELPQAERHARADLEKTEPLPEGTKVLVVDDDVRNIFAITSLLELHEAQVVFAESGSDALRVLEKDDDINLVLADIMMPEMDGYELIRRIRLNPRWSKLPIIAVTAKAMGKDREKCIAAGASEYVSKPVEVDLLLAMIRVALSRGLDDGQPAPAPARPPTAS